MKTWTGAIGVFLLLAFAGSSPAAEWFVATNGNDAAEGTNWATAKLTIQAGIDAAACGATVWVSNGVYATGGRATSDILPLTNRVIMAGRAVTVQSVNGPLVTIIQGAKDPSAPDGFGDAAIRCAYVDAGSVLSGFTLTNGATSSSGNDTCGGGVFGGGLGQAGELHSDWQYRLLERGSSVCGLGSKPHEFV